MQTNNNVLTKRFFSYLIDFLSKAPIILLFVFKLYFDIFVKLHNPDFFFHPKRLFMSFILSFFYNPIHQLILLYGIIILTLNLYLMSKGQTIGKRILNLKVVDMYNCQPVSFLKMFIRETVGKYVSSFCMLGFLWILIDDNDQGWHGKMTNSIVKRKNS